MEVIQAPPSATASTHRPIGLERSPIVPVSRNVACPHVSPAGPPQLDLRAAPHVAEQPCPHTSCRRRQSSAHRREDPAAPGKSPLTSDSSSEGSPDPGRSALATRADSWVCQASALSALRSGSSGRCSNHLRRRRRDVTARTNPEVTPCFARHWLWSRHAMVLAQPLRRRQKSLPSPTDRAQDVGAASSEAGKQPLTCADDGGA
jgi:hypothetical protein